MVLDTNWLRMAQARHRTSSAITLERANQTQAPKTTYMCPPAWQSLSWHRTKDATASTPPRLALNRCTTRPLPRQPKCLASLCRSQRLLKWRVSSLVRKLISVLQRHPCSLQRPLRDRAFRLQRPRHQPRLCKSQQTRCSRRLCQ